MSCGLYNTLWVFLNVIIFIYETLYSSIRKLKAFYLKAYDLVTNHQGSYEIDFLEQCKPKLLKIPKHLSIIIGTENDTTFDVLSKIAAYALIMDIDYISFYDTRRQFTLENVQVPKFVSSKRMQNGNFLWSMSGEKNKSARLKYKNGLEKAIEVVMLNEKDGKPLIAEVCRELFEKRNSAEIQDVMTDRSKLSNKITSLLQKKLNRLPDPDCAIIFNKYMCTFGLLPWSTGFTEFHLIKTGSYFNVETFAEVLFKFSKCEQRFGN